MKRRSTQWTRGLAVATLALAFGSPHAVAAKSGDSKYGVVDMQQVIVSVEEGKDARSDLEKEIKKKREDLQEKKSELDDLKKKWKDQAALLSEEARLKKQQKFQQKFMKLRNEEMKFQRSIKRKEQEATQKIAMKVAQVVEKIAEDQKLTAVFETNSSGLLYLQNPVDLTKKVIDLYPKVHGGSKDSEENKEG